MNQNEPERMADREDIFSRMVAASIQIPTAGVSASVTHNYTDNVDTEPKVEDARNE